MKTLFLVLLLAGCSSDASPENDSFATFDSSQEYAESDPADIDPADVEEPVFLCTEDCSGHEAGFQWAAEQDVTDPSECGGNSESFIEGCEGFAEQRALQAEEEAEEEAEEADEYGE